MRFVFSAISSSSSDKTRNGYIFITFCTGIAKIPVLRDAALTLIYKIWNLIFLSHFFYIITGSRSSYNCIAFHILTHYRFNARLQVWAFPVCAYDENVAFLILHFSYPRKKYKNAHNIIAFIITESLYLININLIIWCFCPAVKGFGPQKMNKGLPHENTPVSTTLQYDQCGSPSLLSFSL